ncbi:MAG: helix-turn-helix domain-containing protein, partial [Deltaproteobacteria bacterium]|nr:helix-turn-helix domain-containing protein [Deltaproteobacteria bacterium]
PGGSIRAEDLAQTTWSPCRVPVEYSLAKNEIELIVRVMEKCNWNKREAARLLDISRGTLYSKLKKFNIRQQGGK